MAREYARIKVSIWNDNDWRETMSLPAQALYTTLLTDPGINLAGVCDWRPNRIARKSRGATVDLIRAAAAELQDGPRVDGSGPARFVLVDEETEEILIRSFVRHDDVLKSPNMTVAMCNAQGMTASPLLREWIAWEAWRGIRDNPTLKGAPIVKERLAEPKTNPSDPVPLEFDADAIAGWGWSPLLCPPGPALRVAK